MSKNLQLAVNHAISQISRARMQLLMQPSIGIDAKRSSAWCEYGFKENLDFNDLYNLYRRSGIAHGVVEKVIGRCWLTNPEIIEGDKYDDARPETRWERQIKTVFTNRFWRSFAEADRRRLVGVWSALILHIKDDGAWDEPVTRAAAIAKVKPVWRSAIIPSDWDDNPSSSTYGEPIMWQYTERACGSKERVVKIHSDRIFILGDYSDDAIGFLEPSFNAFVSIEKVEGGSGESFLKNAARQLNINFDKEIDLGSLASLYNVNISDLQESLNSVATEINRGNDALLTTQGATVTPLVTSVADPKPTYEVNQQSAMAGVGGLPIKEIVGSQTGERASTEDRRSLNSTCQSRRGDLSFEIDDFLDKLIALKIIDPVAEKTVIWDDLNEQSPSDKLDVAYKMSQVNQQSISYEPVFSAAEIRAAAGYETNDSESLGEEVALDESQESKDANTTV